MIPVFIRAYPATADIRGRRIVDFTDRATGAGISEATTATARPLGVSDRMGAPAGGMCDVHRLGLVHVELGGAVKAGDALAADAQGRAVVAASPTAAGVVGWADQPGIAGDIIDIWMA